MFLEEGLRFPVYTLGLRLLRDKYHVGGRLDKGSHPPRFQPFNPNVWAPSWTADVFWGQIEQAAAAQTSPTTIPVRLGVSSSTQEH